MRSRTIAASSAVFALALLGAARAEAQVNPAPMEGMAMPRRPLDLPPSRDGSGTSWQPDTTPMYGLGAMPGGWMIMVHGNVFAGYDLQQGERGDRRITSPNWLMAMARRSLGKAEIGGRLMLSAEPFTVGPRGYPLLLQTGETYRGEPLHDRQHPHDLFMEIAALLTLEVSDDLGLQLYAAPAGEPALGPEAFPHRASASSDPLAPIGHHWQDATHVSYGVLTAGVFTRHVKLEGSWFNGREPDEDRYDLDLRAPRSFAGRLTVQPTRALVAQVSYGFLKSPEALAPATDVHRITASATLDVRLGSRGNWATTAAWGRNVPTDEPATSAWLLEADANLDGHDIVFGRAEYAQKTGRDLALPAADERRIFHVGSASLGFLYEAGPFASLLGGVGIRGTVDVVGADLAPVYGSRFPVGAMVFVRLRPAEMKPMEHGGRHGKCNPPRPRSSAGT